MEHRIVVSVIIAAFNAEEYIVKAISSALDQTMADVEVIVVDDGSTDDTVSMIENMRDERVRLYKMAYNQGPSFCRNYAIARAKGDWIAILDSDDWWAPTRLDTLLRYGDRDEAHVVCDDLYLVKDETSCPHHTYLTSRETVIGRVTEPKMIMPLQMIREDYGVLQPVIRANFLRENSIRYKVGHHFGEDFLYLLDCLLAGAKMMLYPEPLYYYRTGHPSSSTSLDNPEGQCRLLEEIISSSKYSKVHDVKEALQERLMRKRLIVEELRAKQLFQRKQYLRGFTTVLRHPKLLVGYARSVKRRMANSN